MINFKRKYSVHFVGIGGVSMHSLAQFCLSLGWKVSGSDVKKNSYTKNLVSMGVNVFVGHNKSNLIAPDFVVKTSAVKDDNEEITYAKKLGIKVYDRADLLAEITNQFKTVIAVSGAHGKSTTSAMIYQILRGSGKKVSCHIGADVENARFDLSDDILVLEACEYNKTFLKFKIDIGIVLNVDKEHIDSYGSFYNLKLAFKTFLNHAKKRYVFNTPKTKYLIMNGVEPISKPVIKSNCFLLDGKKYILDKSLGEQYLLDAVVAVKVCSDLGVDYDTMFAVLKSFKPLARRNQLIKSASGCNIYIDYAHHPTEIKYLIKHFGKDSLYVFQPHTFSRTKYLQKEFVEVFADVNVAIFKEYSARESQIEGLSSFELFEKIKEKNSSATYIETEEQLSSINIKDYNNIIFVGAGDINEVAKRYSLNLI